jgi:hypothetical protein
MSTLSTDYITDAAGTGAPDFSNGLISSGNVGIGTSSPGFALDVQGATDPSIRVRATGTTSSDDSLIRMQIAGTTANNILQFGDSADADAGYISYDHASDYLAVGVNAAERMRITSSGNVGIGTTTPTSKLDVVGDITVTGTVDGRDLSTDGAKLDGIAANANNYSLPAATSAVRGGVELFSDTVQTVAANAVTATASRTYGIQANASGQLVVNVPWVDTDTTLDSTKLPLAGGTMTGAITFAAGQTWPTFNQSTTGNAATATTATALNTANNYRVNSLGVGTAGSGTAGEIRATNNITAYYSDDRLKTKLGVIDNALEKVLSLSGFYYEANSVAQALGYEVKQEVGVSAQEVQAVMPEVVAPAPIDERYLTVRYERLIPLLIEAIKEQQQQLDKLKAKLGE